MQENPIDCNTNLKKNTPIEWEAPYPNPNQSQSGHILFYEWCVDSLDCISRI